jgi:CheY-like chemotaxis protein
MTRKKVRVAALSGSRAGASGSKGPMRRPVLFLCKTPASKGRTWLRSASLGISAAKSKMKVEFQTPSRRSRGKSLTLEEPVVNAPNRHANVFGGSIASEVSLSQLRVLVVEDEGLIALNLELILRRFGCEVVGLVSEVSDIVDAVKKHRPDGIFLDVNLRGRKVFDVLPELISLGIPFVLSSGYDDPTQFPAAFRNLPRIAKPFDESALRRVCVEFGSLAEARQADKGRVARLRKARRANASARTPLRLASRC